MFKSGFIHQTADVSPNASIGYGTSVWRYSCIREGAEVGDNCVIGQGVYLDPNVVIGNGVKIQNGVSIYHGVVVEDDVFIGPNVAFANNKYPRAFIKYPTRVDEEIDHPTLIKTGASIGSNATIICGVTLGAYSVVGAGSVVTKSVPNYTLVLGNPAQPKSLVCRCGKPVKWEDWNTTEGGTYSVTCQCERYMEFNPKFISRIWGMCYG